MERLREELEVDEVGEVGPEGESLNWESGGLVLWRGGDQSVART